MKKGRRFSLFWAHRGGFHGRMAVGRKAALGRVGNLFIGLLSLKPALGPAYIYKTISY